MTKENSDNLRDLLKGEIKKLNDSDQRQEQIRQALEQRARAILNAYEEEWKLLEPTALEQIRTVIQPWFDDLVSSGNYERLLQLVEAKRSQGRSNIPLARSIPYIWPRDLYRELQESLPYAYSAKSISGKDDQPDLAELSDPSSEHISVWEAGFQLSSDAYAPKDDFQKLRIWRQPTEGLGYGWGMSQSNYFIPVDVQSIEASIQQIHPEVWTGFAAEIAAGRADERLQAWAKRLSDPRPRQVVYQTSADANREAGATRASYLISRGLKP